MSKECFVIQPISDIKFTKRYDDVYKPAIEAAGLNAYRVDLDPAVKILIEEIESRIKDATICFADISSDNPNVWYELGYAFASGKDVVMVCDESRKDFPFDIRHKNIILYKTESTSDFDSLKEKITETIKAYIQSQKTTEEIPVNSVIEEIYKPYNWHDSDILFSSCIALTFPGDRNIVWYKPVDAVQRLNLFFENIRSKEPHGDVVWWRRGYQAFPIKEAKILDKDKILLENCRFQISRMAVLVSSGSYKQFIYIEADAEPPTGLYPEINDNYIQSMQYEGNVLEEEYAEFEGRLITRQEYDDGAFVYDGKVIQHNGNAVLRVRYLTKVNFILTAKNSPYNNKRFEMESIELFNNALQSEENVCKLFDFLNTFQKIDMPEYK